MLKDYHHTKTIQMSAQTAELQILGNQYKEEMQISCSLMNIARGNCNLKLKPVDLERIDSVGTLDISIKRPVMNAEIFLKLENFNRLIDLFRMSFPRPVTIVILLNRKLTINKVGDLILDKQTNLKILDISWSIPLT